MTIPLQKTIVYGPLNSRRFGNSLGINLLPVTHKICSFECLYCQYDEAHPSIQAIFPPTDIIEKEIRENFIRIRNVCCPVDSITFSGNGEPTLHPEFPLIVDQLISLRDSLLPKIPISILSNSSTCHLEKTRNALMKLDGRFMKLDAGEATLFNQLNVPRTSEVWEKIIEGLCRLPNIVLQSMFVKGKIDNTSSSHVEKWIETVGRVRPMSVHLVTIQRPPRDKEIFPVLKTQLESIAKSLLEKKSIPAYIYD